MNNDIDIFAKNLTSLPTAEVGERNIKKVVFTIADNSRQEEVTRLKKSLSKFHPDWELKVFGEDFVKEFNDPQFYYRAKPIIAMKLFNEGYDAVCGMDSDQIIVGDLSDIWEGDYDVACVLNDPTYPIGVFDIHPYFNNGLVVMRNKEFVYHWFRLCQSEHFQHFQFREQDILNILASDYHNYKVRNLDEGNKIYGESAKKDWNLAEMGINQEGENIYILGRQLCVIHFGGGVNGNKGNYRTKFTEEVVNKIDQLIK